MGLFKSLHSWNTKIRYLDWKLECDSVNATLHIFHLVMLYQSWFTMPIKSKQQSFTLNCTYFQRQNLQNAPSGTACCPHFYTVLCKTKQSQPGVSMDWDFLLWCWRTQPEQFLFKMYSVDVAWGWANQSQWAQSFSSRVRYKWNQSRCLGWKNGPLIRTSLLIEVICLCCLSCPFCVDLPSS